MPGVASVDVKAAVMREKSGKFFIEDLSLEAPRSDEVLVRVAGVGVCHTDLVCRDQYFPVPLPYFVRTESAWHHRRRQCSRCIHPQVDRVL